MMNKDALQVRMMMLVVVTVKMMLTVAFLA